MNIDTSNVTVHSIDRTMERCNIKNERTAVKHLNLALQRGKRAGDFSSWERAYLSNEAHDNCSAIAYNNFCYIVNELGRCVTVHPLPTWFGKRKRFDGKEKIRDYKKYCKSNQFYRERYAIC